MIGVVLNPNARGVARDRTLGRRLRALLDTDGELIETPSPEELPAAVAYLARRGCDVVASCGGDGTNLSLLTQLVRHHGPDRLPRYAILRGGTVNTVASALGIVGRPEELLGRLVVRQRNGQPLIERGQDLIEVNGLYGFLFAAAMGARFLETYYQGPTHLGPGWAVALTARTALSTAVAGPLARRLFAPLPATLVGDGERLPIQALRVLVAATIPTVGVGFRVPWRGGQQPNRFHLVASALSLGAMARQLDRVLTGRPLQGQPHVDRLLQELIVEFDGEEPFTLDGDLYRARRIALRVGPRIWVAWG